MRCAAFLIVLGLASQVYAADHYGRVTFGGLPVPGAMVTAAQAERQIVAIADLDGVYRLADLADGVWNFRIEMLGFAPLTEDVAISADAPPRTWALTLLPFEEITRGLTISNPEPTTPASALIASAARQQAGFQRAAVTASAGAPAVTNDPTAPDDRGLGAADGFLVDGSVNNGAASPFAQMAAFGNNRRNGRSLYNGGIALQLGNSAWDARPFSFTGQNTPKPGYSDVQIGATLTGPLRIPKLLRNGPNMFLGYQRTTDNNVTTQSALMPTMLERAGDFSQTLDVTGRPIQIVDPVTGLPFRGQRIPETQLSPQALALLRYYPPPNLSSIAGPNYQTPVLIATRQDSLQSRFTQALRNRNQLFGNVAYQRTTTETANVFGFADTQRSSGLDSAANWSRRISQLLSVRLRYQFTRLASDLTPFFAGVRNVSGEAGIRGNSQDPADWGPPSLTFSSGIAGLASAQFGSSRNRTHAWGAETLWSRGRHNFTFGGDIRRQHIDAIGQQDARGTFGFTGAATGSDLADFLLGIPHTSSIALGNADKFLRASAYDAYITDDWRVNASLTANIGIRWEYESPFTERFGRLVNLDVAPGFTAVAPMLANSPIGSITGERYPDSLLRPDKTGFQPRIGIAWRPIAGSSLVIRAGYGVYRNTAIYQAMTMLLAQQPPLSKTWSVENSPANPLTLANGFVSPAPGALSTFAVDPDLRVGLAQNWQILAQRDLPGSLTITATYLGTKGSRLLQEFLPNTYPAGAESPCPACPDGFVYLTSTGSSSRHSGQLQLRRRLRNGLTASAKYTLSKATDDAGAFTGVTLNGSAIAQDWLNLDAEHGPSNFDQRHLLNVEVQYTTGVGVLGGTLLDGVRGSLFKGWTFAGHLTAGSALPLTPIYLTSVRGTGFVGMLRPDVVGSPSDAAPGYYVNPSAYAAPAAGRWGNAGRNSIRGPAQFSLNAGISRTFLWGDRLNLDWRLDATNILNRVTYASLNTVVGSPQFGLPNVANPMRRVQSSLRLRF